MFEYLALTDGTTILDLTDNISYALVSYGPIIAPLADNQLHVSPYQDVTESIAVHAIGCTAAEAYQAAAAIDTLLNQARRWWDSENVSAVLLLAKAQGSALEPLSVAVKGRASGAPPNVALPATWDAQIGRYVIKGITIEFVRRAELLSSQETTAVSAAANNPVVQSVSFASSPEVFSPASVYIGGFTPQKAATFPQSFLCIADAVTKLDLQNVSGLNLGPFTTVNDAANLPISGATILRYTPVGTAVAESARGAALPPYGLTFGTGALSIFALLRNNSLTVPFLVSARVEWGATSITTPPVVIDTSTQNPRWVFLGIVVINNAGALFTSPGIYIQAQATSIAGGPTLDFSALAQVNLDEATSSVVATQSAVLTNNFPLATTPVVLAAMSRALTHPTPALFVQSATGASVNVQSQGTPWVASNGPDIAALWLATRSNFWRFVDHTNTTLQVTLQADRRPAFLAPQ